MADVHSSETRSYNMSRIRSKNTKPEMLVRKFIFSKGFRYRLHDNKLPGKPDIILPKYKTVIFINGCFWHQHLNCKFAVSPKSNTEYWSEKINRNLVRDEFNVKHLKSIGWKIIIIWECDLKTMKFEETMLNLIQLITE